MLGLPYEDQRFSVVNVYPQSHQIYIYRVSQEECAILREGVP